MNNYFMRLINLDFKKKKKIVKSYSKIVSNCFDDVDEELCEIIKIKKREIIDNQIKNQNKLL